ncbi:MAG: hypothetical protein C4528_04650 [Gammaproteobacteria bacterium]|nr:MAG: hypothetical protein C4528_04650 [Gammaproteobacteria bacterium]
MAATRNWGWVLLLGGAALVFLALYISDSLMLLQSSLLHFVEHMQMLWADMALMPRVALALGVLALLAGVLVMVFHGKRARRDIWH